MKVCVICGKGTIPGVKYKRRGMAKRKGGAGSKIVGKTLRRFKPNLQTVKINMNGFVRRRSVCATCITNGRIVKA
jgi:large subunit ribosomal protein L28